MADTAMRYHLGSNHFPPINEVFDPVAREAIDRANAGEWDHEITMPNGVTLTVESIVDQLHLHFFLDDEDVDYHS